MKRSILRALALLVGLTALVLAHAGNPKHYRQWLVDTFDDKSGAFAVTINDSNAVFGEACFLSDQKCQWRVVIDVACEKGHTYPILANTDSGAASLEFVCDGPRSGGEYTYVFSNWKALESLLKTATRVGFAMPMQGDQFTVYRFNLDGANAATEFLESTFFAATPQGKKKTTPSRDTATQSL